MVVGLITTYALSAYHHQHCELEPRSGEIYSIQHYVIKFVSDLRQLGGFLWVLFFSTDKTEHHDITEILLRVALSTLSQTKPNHTDQTKIVNKSVINMFCKYKYI